MTTVTTTTTTKKQLVGSLGREGSKLVITECILKQFVPMISAAKRLVMILAKNEKKNHISKQHECAKETSHRETQAIYVLPFLKNKT